jgi:hypothetical protein
MSEQDNWRWCNKCQVLAYAGSPSPGPCAAGGNHDHAGSGNYVLSEGVLGGPNRQGNWRWCNKCQVLAYAGSPSPGPCAAGGNHDHTGSGNYVLTSNVPVGPYQQGNWKWCNKCQVLAYAGSPSPGPCAAGGNHDHTGSGNYVLNYPTPLPNLLEISKLDGSPWTNPPFDTSDPNWSSNVVGGKTFDGTSAHPFEWVSVLNPTVQQDDQIGISGIAVHPTTPTHGDNWGAYPAGPQGQDELPDLPFTHPFGPDYEFQIVPDPQYENLLGSANKVRPNGPPGTIPVIGEQPYFEAWQEADALHLNYEGVLGMEVDDALVPAAYRFSSGDRVALYGRWIVDAGHPGFHTEIHPPLLMARARSLDANGSPVARSSTAITEFQLWSRPYQAGQLFSTGGDFETSLQGGTNLDLKTYVEDISTTLGSIEAFPPVFSKPFDGIHVVAFTVRPPVPPPSSPVGPIGAVVPHSVLECSYHFTVNGSCGVEVIQSPAEPNTILVILSLNSVGYPQLPELPHQFDSVQIAELVASQPSSDSVLQTVLETVLEEVQGTIQFRRYSAPSMSQTQDSVNVVPFTPLASLPSQTVATDKTQPFPVYGWLKLYWNSTRVVTAGGAP